jgi:hypothetical protein
VDIGYAKGGARSVVGQRAACLQVIVKNEIGVREICIIFHQRPFCLVDRFPLVRSAILTLGKLRRLGNFRLVLQEQGLNEHPHFIASNINFQRKVVAMEQIFRELARQGSDCGMPGLDAD